MTQQQIEMYRKHYMSLVSRTERHYLNGEEKAYRQLLKLQDDIDSLLVKMCGEDKAADLIIEMTADYIAA